MDFTRDPIIETIISPKDGFKLSVRNSRSVNQEEHIVSALEVVSFGSALFFRSLERPKAFLLPISDYEVVEVKEARMVLKNVSLEKPIKIGDGKDSKSSDEKESSKKDSENKKGTKKRTSRRKRSSSKTDQPTTDKEARTQQPKSEPSNKGGEEKDEAKPSSSVETEPALPPTPIVFPTPPKVIGRKLSDTQVQEVPKGDVLPDELASNENPIDAAIVENETQHSQEEMSLEEVKEAVADETVLETSSKEKKED
ncbi:MAG: hypothetical protein S4CHLAM6_11430 [Chlamydiae bacterium]|nr:hypothetical protein [Chlamydiota bacterium]